MKNLKKVVIIFIILIFFCILNANEKVSFLQDTVFELDGRVLKFLSGSIWLLDYEILSLPLNDGIVVFKGYDPYINEENIDVKMKNLPKSGVLFYEGNEVPVTLVEGVFFLTNGILTEVIKEMGDGAILKTSDGLLWSIPTYDQYDTGYWLPPYKVIIHSNELYMTNLKKGKRIWISKMK
jgi:hypothetical protein